MHFQRNDTPSFTRIHIHTHKQLRLRVTVSKWKTNLATVAVRIVILLGRIITELSSFAECS